MASPGAGPSPSQPTGYRQSTPSLLTSQVSEDGRFRKKGQGHKGDQGAGKGVPSEESRRRLQAARQ